MSLKNSKKTPLSKVSFDDSYAVDYIEDSVVDYAEDDGLNLSTDYAEDYVEDYAEDYAEDYVEDDAEEGIIAEIFSEEEYEEPTEFSHDMTLKEVLDQMDEDGGSFKNLSEELEDIGEELDEIVEENPDVTLGDMIPGTSVSSRDIDGEEEEVETDYANDKDLSKFMEYITGQYPASIPPHDGRTTVGCERAISFLERLNSDISRAIKDDVDGILDLAELESVRANIMHDVIKLKQHLGNLKKKLKEVNAKTNESEIPLWKNSQGKLVDPLKMEKSASVPNNLVIAVTPFERAITGIMINSHVSAGRAMADTFEALKKKYDISEREELAIMQICMDSGFPIFKDRGTAGSEDDEGTALDFVKNYFA